ncbi:MAG: amino-acid N-acetyltransferase [Pseudohongiellaceae bacterium]
MLNNQDLINWFRASTSYINAHRGKTFVVLISGEALVDSNFPNIVYDLNLLHSLGVKLVLVTGARPQISAALEQKGLTSVYHEQVRVTEHNCLDTVIETVGKLTTKTEALLSMGLSNSPMDGADIRVCRGNFVTAQPHGIHDGVDYHFTGKVRKIKSEAIHQQLQQGNIVLLSNLGYSLTGEVFNLTAEEIATEVAISLSAEKLILLTPTEGVIDNSGKLIPSLNPQDAESLLQSLEGHQDLDSECLKKAIGAALSAVENGIHRSHLISFKQNGALLQELFTREGKGSLISGDSFESLRPAHINDVAGILALIKPLEDNGTLVTRSRELLETEIDNFHVIEFEGTLIACAALYPISDGIAEVACIAIHKNYRNKGYGDRLLLSLEKTALELNVEKIFALTTVTDHWFLEKGFARTELDELPEARKQLYNFSRKSKVLIKHLTA